MAQLTTPPRGGCCFARPADGEQSVEGRRPTPSKGAAGPRAQSSEAVSLLCHFPEGERTGGGRDPMLCVPGSASPWERQKRRFGFRRQRLVLTHGKSSHRVTPAISRALAVWEAALTSASQPRRWSHEPRARKPRKTKATSN